jgi:nitrite reductase/ring-hydroxylating ferredoxin subunit
MEQPLIAVDDIPEDGAVTVDFFGREVLVYRVDGEPRATANVCTHLGGPLSACGNEFVCAWHGATFDVATGARRSGPARPNTKLMHLPTKADDGQLLYIWRDDSRTSERA